MTVARRARACGLLIVLVLAAAQPPAGEAGSSRPGPAQPAGGSGGSPADAARPGLLLPSESCRGFIIVPVSTGGARLELLLDTGSSWTFVDPEAARRVAGRVVRRRRVSLKDARIGDHRLGTLSARVFPMAALGRAVGRPIDGILGFPAFRDVLLTLDYPRSEVRVAGGRLPPVDGEQVFRDTGGRRPWLRAELGGRRIELLLDSGAAPGFLQLRRSDPLEWAVEPRPAAATALFSGIVIDEAGRLAHALRLGPLTFSSPVAFVTGRERLVGWQLLRHFAVTFDQRSRRIRLDPGELRGPVAGPPRVSIGFGKRARREGWEVLVVFAGTPAERAGLRPGDLVTAIDGTPVYERSCPDPAGYAAGQQLRLSYLRDGVAGEVEISTAAVVP